MSSSVAGPCPRCGLARKPSARFCKRCGERLAGEPAPWHVWIGTGTPSSEVLRQLIEGGASPVPPQLEPPDPHDPCGRCGQPLRTRARYCPRCGAARGEGS